MSTLPTLFLTVAGALLIAVALRDVFDVLFHETGRAVMSHTVMRSVWRVLRVVGKRRKSVFVVAGPLALLSVVVLWALLLIVGWAFVFWPHMPDGFTFATSVGRGHAFVDSLYVSMVTLATVGFGDIAPNAAGLRVLTPLEALLGFGLLTASISWLLSIYPVLSRRRSLAYEVNLLVDAQETLDQPLLELGEPAAESVLSELTSRLVAVERDLATLPVSYYFAEANERFSLPATMPALLELSERARDESQPARVRLRAAMLHDAIDDFAHTVHGFHSRGGDATDEMLRDYARDHLR